MLLDIEKRLISDGKKAVLRLKPMNEHRSQPGWFSEPEAAYISLPSFFPFPIPFQLSSKMSPASSYHVNSTVFSVTDLHFGM